MSIEDKIFSIKEKTIDRIFNNTHYAKEKIKSEMSGKCIILKTEDGEYEVDDPDRLKEHSRRGECDLGEDTH